MGPIDLTPMIERVVRTFYERVRADALLAPIFAAKIDDWEPHLQRMFALWSSVALMSGRCHGQPMAKHMAAESLELGVAGANGLLVPKGARYRAARKSGA